MSIGPAKLNVNDSSTWTRQSVEIFISTRQRTKAFFQNFFDWSDEEYTEARLYTSRELEKHPFDGSLPTTGPNAHLRHSVQVSLVRDRPDIFIHRHGPHPPAWFVPDLINKAPLPRQAFTPKNVIQHFIAIAFGTCRSRRKSLKKFKNQSSDFKDEESDEELHRPLSKRPRTSLSESVPSLPSSLSMPMSRKSSVTMTCHQMTSEDRTQSNGIPLILYITSVAIVDQNLVLERNRFGIVDNLFEHGLLIESRIQELIFGNPLDNKPTFLWFFDETRTAEPRVIRNRPCAEAAILILKASADRKDAAGIQLFDAPDSETVALVPAHEVTRTRDFAARVSFELELDDDDNDDTNDANGGANEDDLTTQNLAAHGKAEVNMEEQSETEEVDIEADMGGFAEVQGRERQETRRRPFIASDGESDSESEEE